MIPIIIISGPSGVGKSRAAILLAKKINGEIISADSIQVYKYFNIGSDKPLLEDRGGVTHHMLDVVNPDEEFNADDFNERSYSVIKEIHKRGNKIIICGGTGLYIKALIENFSLGVGKDPEIKKWLKDRFPDADTFKLYERLKEVDSISANKINQNDRYRIERALEVFYSSGIPLSEHWLRQSTKPRFIYDYFILNRERLLLYRRIEERVDNMIKNGLLFETQKIFGLGYDFSLKPFQSIGYKQMIEFIQHKIDFKSAVNEIKQGTRRFAKRQLTWFRGIKNGKWIDIDDCMETEDVIEKIEFQLENK